MNQREIRETIKAFEACKEYLTKKQLGFFDGNKVKFICVALHRACIYGDCTFDGYISAEKIVERSLERALIDTAPRSKA